MRDLFAVSALFVLSISLVFAASCGDDAEPAVQEEEVSEEIPETKDEAATLTNQGKGDFSLDICKARDWYGDGECDWYCLRRDEDCNADPIFEDPAGDSTRYPIVLAHGFMGAPNGIWAYKNVEEALIADGHAVYTADVAPFHSPSFRAEQLAEDVDAALADSGAEKVNVVAHSMGGIDARYMISTLGYGDRVASLTTISSPHRGTRVADVALELVPGFADKALDSLLVLVGQSFSEEGDEASLREALEGIAESNMGTFNADNPDDDRVYYQSWAGVSSITGLRNRDTDELCEGKSLVQDGTYDHMTPLLWAIVPIVARIDIEPNDGMALVSSSKWGEFHGCIPADHVDQVGPLDEEPDLDTGFFHESFYRHIAFDLAARGH